MKPHPLSRRRLMNDEEYGPFKQDVKENGQLDAIIRYEGMILDGNNRYRACKPQAKPVSKPEEKEEPKPNLGMEDWNRFLLNLTTSIDFVADVKPKNLPTELESWKLVKVLEETARKFLMAAAQLRSLAR